MRFKGIERRRFQAFDLTPMIDVVFQLIIFFMFTARFGEITRTEIDLPREAGRREPAADAPSVVIDIDHAGRILVQGESVGMDRLAAIVSAEIQRAGGPEGVSVQVRADRSGRAAVLNDVTRRVAALGVTRWSIATIDTGEQP